MDEAAPMSFHYIHLKNLYPVSILKLQVTNLEQTYIRRCVSYDDGDSAEETASQLCIPSNKLLTGRTTKRNSLPFLDARSNGLSCF